MTYDQHLAMRPWGDYELLDSGEGMKLERFGEIVLARPETQALWDKQQPELWKEAHAIFVVEDKKGSWKIHKPIPESWVLAWNEVRVTARLTNFKHTGIFPEQAPNWAWVEERVLALRGQQGAASEAREPGIINVLNLFGYTGVATLVAAHAGANVTHVDASKQSLDWAHENARLTGITEDRIRWILDDALAFVKREVRRGAKYSGIVLDPPAFGRGAKGEVWRIEEDLPTLLAALKELLASAPNSFLLVNGYAAGYASRSFAQAVEGVFGETPGESGELHVPESHCQRVIPSGIYARFVR